MFYKFLWLLKAILFTLFWIAVFPVIAIFMGLTFVYVLVEDEWEMFAEKLL